MTGDTIPPDSHRGGQVWVLADDRVGNMNQCLGVAEALAAPYQVKQLEYNRFARLPNILLGASLVHIRAPFAATIAPPWPAVVIAAGRRTVPVARVIKRRAGGRTFLVQTMWPGPPAADLDLIATPEHDSIRDRANMIRTIGAPHRVTAARLSAESDKWCDRLAGVRHPRIALVVGGDTRKYRFSRALAADLARLASNLALRLGGALMVTTSRRTRPDARRALLDNIAAEASCFVWTREAQDNPYLAYLALGDAIIVTGDSTSMCTEACATGRPVYIHAPPDHTAAKHKRLHDRLYALGCARPLKSAIEAGELADWRYPPLDDAAKIGAEIARRARL
ncbi:MAG: mitochondrial fission ELM1 family protein [Alphaproteobacteria bacterium]|nr:mitochondrial fission ELM1 family protein [Alphaproteobacteria bacterium]MDP6517823.1 mitochondrial fission ELM1 family protein [Alphaproteobacteria bacterium]